MFKQLKVLVTGGASTFGRSTVQRLVKNGATVVFCDQPSSNGEEIAKEIGGSVSYMPADIAKEYDVRNLLKEIQNAHGGLNVLLNCASVEKRQNIYDFAQKRPAQLDDLQAIIKNNVLGTLNVIRLSASIMAKNEPDASNLRGTILNMAHSSGVNPSKEDVLNAAASSAIIGMNRSLARDLGTHGIRVLTIVPNVSLKGPENTDNLTDPDDFAHIVQCCIVNTYLNATTIKI